MEKALTEPLKLAFFYEIKIFSAKVFANFAEIFTAYCFRSGLSLCERVFLRLGEHHRQVSGLFMNATALSGFKVKYIAPDH